MGAAHFDTIVSERFGTGECPTWDEVTGRLLWTSIDDGDIHALHLTSGRRQVWHFDSTVGSFGLCRSGRMVVALRDSVVLFDPATGESQELAAISLPAARFRLNDGKVGPDGAFWVGSFDMEIREPLGALYRVSPTGEVRVIREGLLVSNGLAWSPDGRVMYHADSRGPWVERYDFDPATGEATNRTRFRDFDDAAGRPDGATVDAAGNYWVAGPSASLINCFAPDGRLLHTLPTPSFRPTMPCFGGADMRTLFVTSLDIEAPAELAAQYPHCGKILALDGETAGLPTHRFAD